jgi:hypothetical protein
MAAVQEDEIAREMTRLQRAVDAVVASALPPDLPTIRSVLAEAATAIEAISVGQAAGGFVVDIPPDRQRLYFPHHVEDQRQPTGDEVARADAGWRERRVEGRRFREEALAQLGPVLTPAEAAAHLGVSAMTLSNWRRQGKILGLRFDGHQYLYPTFQFAQTPAEGERGVVRDLDHVLAALGDRTPWEKARYLITAWPYLRGRTPLDLLRDAGDAADRERVITYARHAGEMGT